MNPFIFRPALKHVDMLEFHSTLGPLAVNVTDAIAFSIREFKKVSLKVIKGLETCF